MTSERKKKPNNVTELTDILSVEIAHILLAKLWNDVMFQCRFAYMLCFLKLKWK